MSYRSETSLIDMKYAPRALQKMAENAYEGRPLHFIGHLQRNKVRQVVGKADLIQSVGSAELLQEIGCSEDLIHAVCSHGYGICCDVEPVEEMEKVLFAADELTGLIGAAARMRPSKSVQDMEVSSLKKKYKDKKFAAGCSRDVINTGAERLGWPIEELMEKTILAMRSCEDAVNEAVLAL